MSEQAPDSKPVGEPSEFASAFKDAVVAAVRDEGDPKVQGQIATALSLGWYLAALAHPADVLVTAAGARGDLTGSAGVSDDVVLAFCRQHVEVALTRLKSVLEEAAPEDVRLTELRECVASAEAAARREAAEELDGRLVAIFSAVDFRLSKAYTVGRGLMNLTSTPPGDRKLADHLSAAAMAPLVADIDDLSSALPPHAGHSVRDSLIEWRASVRTSSRVAPDEPGTWKQLARQGELWRAMLVGEKSGRDMLEIQDYLDAADRLSRKLRSLTLKFLSRFPEIVVVVLILLAGGIALILFTDSEATVLAGAGSVLAALGLTWRGVGRSLGGLASKLEQPLWGAELDTAIRQAITLLAREEERDVTKTRRDVAVALRPDE
jgi:hypothetical protein